MTIHEISCIIKIVKRGKALNEYEEERTLNEEMGMTDNQWKDFLRGYKEDLEELKEYQEEDNKKAFEKKIQRMLKRIQESLES